MKYIKFFICNFNTVFILYDIKYSIYVYSITRQTPTGKPALIISLPICLIMGKYPFLKLPFPHFLKGNSQIEGNP